MSNSTSETFVCYYGLPQLRMAAYALIMVVSLCGNSLIVIVIKNQKLTKKSSHLFMLNMAIADLVVTVTYIPRMMVKMMYGDLWIVTGTIGLTLCRVIPFLHHVTILVSVLTILGATVDRFCAIMYPLRKIVSHRSVKLMIVLSWVIPAVLRSPYLFASYLKTVSDGYSCQSGAPAFLGNKVKIYYDFLLWLYCSILFVLIILYVIVMIKLRTSNAVGASNETAQVRKQKASRKLLKLFLVVTVSFICCWFWYFFVDLVFPRPHPCEISFMRFFLAHINCALNPCILISMDVKFREGFKKLFKLVELNRASESYSASGEKKPYN